MIKKLLLAAAFVIGLSASALAQFSPPSGSGSGTVTSVGISVPATSIFGTSGSPVTTSGTLGLTTTGTSGGIPYFSSTSALSTSAALTANLPVIGGGAGVSPSVGTVSGNTTKFVTTTGTLTSGNCVQIDASGNFIQTSAACGTASAGGSTTQLQSNLSGSLAGITGWTTNGTTQLTNTQAPATNTSTPGLILTDTTAASTGNQQYSPCIQLTGQGWKTTATAASQAVDWLACNVPVQGSTNPSSNLVFSNQINGAGYTVPMSITSAGVLSLAAANFVINAGNPTYISVGANSNSYQFSGNPGTTGSPIQLGLGGTGAQYALGSSAGSFDTFLSRCGAACFQLGTYDVAAPVAQTLQAQSVVAGNGNTAGANLTISGSKSNGSGGGDVLLKTTLSTAASGSQNTLSTALTIKGGTQHIAYGGTSPSVAGACGTGSPSVDANATDSSGTITTGTVTTSCVLTFAKAYASFNHCRVTSQGTISGLSYSYSLSAITIAASVLGGDSIDYHCDGV